MFDKQVIQMIAEGIRDTLYMTLFSTIIGYVIGLPFGVLLHVTSEKGLHPNRIIYRIGDFICNIIRSIPFLILCKGRRILFKRSGCWGHRGGKSDGCK